MALTKFKSQLIADTGISMGDEGKGRLVYEVIDELKSQTKKDNIAGIVIKVNGGANSGHTAGNVKLNLLPAGVIEKSVEFLAIGCGVVADPRKFIWEGEPLERQGYNIFSRLVIDERTLLSDVGHRLLDLAWEKYRVNVLKEAPRGSTGRGITPSYMDEVGQFQIWYSDFLGDYADFEKKLAGQLLRACDTIKYVCKVSESDWDGFFDILTNAELRANATAIEQGVFGKSEFDFSVFKGKNPFELDIEKTVKIYWNAGQKLAKNIADVRELCQKVLEEGRYIIGEFGQAYWLDKRHGFAPNVTASHTTVPEFFQSAALPVMPVHTLGCCKAYDTKVGTHLFLTKMDDEKPLTQKLKKLEFGTSTGRQRMVGWFDCVEKADTLRYGGYDDLIINKLDALKCEEGWEDLNVCVAYKDPQTGKEYEYVPRSDSLRKKLVPVYAKLKPFTKDISNVRSFADLPKEAKDYVVFCFKTIVRLANRGKAQTRVPNLRYIGVGPMPAQIIRDIPSAEELLKM